MKIGELAQRTGVSIRMLRYYETQGLLKPDRTLSGYREFSVADVQTIERIKLLAAAGMTLATIQLFLPCIRGDRPIFEPCDELRQLLQQQIQHTGEKIQQLTASRSILSGFLAEIEQADH